MKQSEKRPTIIYGGAFNPPTRAHNAILQAAIHQAETIDADVWLLPSGNRTDKTIESTIARRLRLVRAMQRDVVARSVTVDVDMSELERKIPIETIDTVDEMSKKFADREFIWIFGSDSVETMPAWKGGEWLVDHLPMLIVERPDAPLKQLGRYATILPVETSDVSSTLVRTRLSVGESIDDLVTPSVADILVLESVLQ